MELPKTMRIDAPKNSKVALIIKDGEIFGGYPGDKMLAEKHLKPNHIYTVERTEIHSWHTTVYLNEIPNVGFNSVLLQEVSQCFNCKYNTFQSTDADEYPPNYTYPSCGKGHWDELYGDSDENQNPDYTFWDNCNDYESQKVP